MGSNQEDTGEEVPPLLPDDTFQAPFRDIMADEIGREMKEDVISLQRVLLDAYEFHGLSDLGKSVFLFIVGLLFLYWQWGTSAAQFKNAMINSMSDWDYGTDWKSMDLQKVDSISKGGYYSLGYLHSAMYKTSLLNIPNRSLHNATQPHHGNIQKQFSMRGNSTVWISEFSQIQYARITADLEGNCRKKGHVIAYSQHRNRTQRNLECYRDLCDLSITPHMCSDPDLNLFFQRWQKIAHRSKHKGKFALTLFTTDNNYTAYDYVSGRNQPVTTVQQSMGLLADMIYGPVLDGAASDPGPTCSEDEMEMSYPPPCHFSSQSDVEALSEAGALPGPVDRRVLGKYGSELKLGIVASDRLSSQEDAAMFTLTFSLRGTFATRLFRLSSTSTIKTDYDNPPLRILDFLYIFFTMWFLRAEVVRWRLCDKQSKSTALYFMYWWNWLQIFSWIANLGFLIWGWSLTREENNIPLNSEDYDRLEYQADIFTAWLMFGTIMVFLLGVSVCRFMRIHLGLKAFYGVFVDAFRMMLDFGVFVMYIMLLLGAIVFAFFQISGGNNVYSDFTDGISAMARLMFLYLSYDQFANFGLGLGQWYWTVTILFFLSAVLLVVFTFNVLLAIFIAAYQKQRANSLRVDFIFMHLVWLRVWFLYFEVFQHYLAVPFYTLMGKRPSAEAVGSPEKHFHAQSSLDETHPGSSAPPPATKPSFLSRLLSLPANYKRNALVLHRTILSRFTKEQDIIYHRHHLLWARWCVARMPETRALVGMYTNYATLKLQRVQWLEIDEAVGTDGQVTARETQESIELSKTVPEHMPLEGDGGIVTSPMARAAALKWRKAAMAGPPGGEGDSVPASPGSNEQVGLFAGAQGVAIAPGLQSRGESGELPAHTTPRPIKSRQGSIAGELQGQDGSGTGQPGGARGHLKWRKDSLGKGLGIALGSVVNSLRMSRRKPKGSEILPKVDSDLTRSELRALLRFIANNSGRLSFGHRWMRWLLGNTPMDHLHEGVIDDVVEAMFETYMYVPHLVRGDDEEEEKDAQEDRTRLMKNMEKKWKSEREEMEVQLDVMRRMLGDVLNVAQKQAGALGRELQTRRDTSTSGKPTARHHSTGY